MYQAYLVDDDELILNEIKENVPWLDNGFEVCGYQTNPILAIEEIVQMKPHVVFCDLMMPAVDGLELMATVKERGISCEFVMLSAYGTFENSRSFFLMQGFNYILKPLQADEAQLVLEKLFARFSVTEKPMEAAVGITDKESGNPAFQELIEYISEHYFEKFTLDRLSRQFGLSPNYICNLFAKNFNTTLTRFITEIRMKEVVQMMKQEKSSFKDIALRCGYQDYFYFCKVFKQYYKESPTQYRKKFLNK